MSNNLINTDYFKRGMSINILQVGSSLILGFISSIVYFSKLSGKEYVIYSLIMLTVYFFVNFSSLELNQYIRKYIPVMDETKSKDIMSLVIGRGGCFFKKWTNYWHIGKIYYDKNSMTISIFIHKNEKSKRNKSLIIKGFIISNIQANIDKYEFVKRMQQQTKTN